MGITGCIIILLHGADVVLFNPRGLIAREEHSLMLLCAGLLLTIAVPTLSLFYFFAWKYRESNTKAIYDSHPRHGKFLVFCLWAIPSAFMLVLASVMWPATHKLAPQQAVAADGSPLVIQVVAMRWKWLFIYPAQNIATVNFIQVPTNTPLQFDLTADEAPMSSFWISHLGGQLYAMTGHVNQLNLIADTPGDYAGRSAEINGAGFADMQFVTRASSTQDFDLWVQQVKRSSAVLDTKEYEKLLSPSVNNPIRVYARAESDLYRKLLIKYSGSHGGHTEH